MTTKYYVLVDEEGSDAFVSCDDNGVPRAFETETEALDECKSYSGSSLILRPVARVTEKTTYKVERFK